MSFDRADSWPCEIYDDPAGYASRCRPESIGLGLGGLYTIWGLNVACGQKGAPRDIKVRGVILTSDK
jgi:hypothetical protein